MSVALPKKKDVTPSQQPVNNLIIGSLALDSISKLETERLYDSNPGSTHMSIGGVGHNIALASHYCDPKASRLVLIVNNDYIGNTILNELQVSKESILQDNDNIHKSASYTSIHNSAGELIIACADMNIIESDFVEHIKTQISKCNPKVVVIDCNLSTSVLEEVIKYCQDLSLQVIVEPTSVIKCAKLGQINLSIGSISLITPTKNEIDTIFETFHETGKFDTEEWFAQLDQYQFNDITNLQLPAKIKQLYNEGYIQKCFRLLPYFSNILLKLGSEGVLSIGIKNQNIFGDKIRSQISSDSFYIDYHPIPKANENLNIVNVTGAGDTFLGYLVTHLGTMDRVNLIHNGQLAAGLSICHNEAINPQIALI